MKMILQVTDFNFDLLEHLLSLTPDQKRTRFFGSVSDDYVLKYYKRTVELGDTWLVQYDRECFNQWNVIGALHIAINHTNTDNAELAFSVKQEYTKKGVASDLMERAISFLKVKSVKTIYMVCLSENIAVKKICQKHGMKIMNQFGEVESEAKLEDSVSISDVSNLFKTPKMSGGTSFSFLNQLWKGILNWKKS